ncbi:MAG: CBS domain-containing protein [Deltaproteobacteria bacterium]|nr:CBS domain-containing protein [Deltaproteobacteria bacterium]MBW2053477.1 CBS domain-containing protein [Deltaproteobacteria bacterium]MBW2142346.1 CBS domain-containing protein [Deltaproteobacteria bacterium]MBW2324775.1 CBS domain-containing protein [Deltaproteobacteria bacterium]
MSKITVKDLMVPREEYATVSEGATLYEAILALEKAQEQYKQSRYKHRAILVYDKDHHIVGKVSQLDTIRGIEAGYTKIGNLKAVSHSGFRPAFIKSLMGKYSLWQQPLEDIVKKAAYIKVKDIMHTPTEGEYISEDDPLEEAIHLLVMGQHQSLLVTRGKKIIGILRLTDVFMAIRTLITPERREDGA